MVYTTKNCFLLNWLIFGPTTWIYTSSMVPLLKWNWVSYRTKFLSSDNNTVTLELVKRLFFWLRPIYYHNGQYFVYIYVNTGGNYRISLVSTISVIHGEIWTILFGYGIQGRNKIKIAITYYYYIWIRILKCVTSVLKFYDKDIVGIYYKIIFNCTSCKLYEFLSK